MLFSNSSSNSSFSESLKSISFNMSLSIVLLESSTARISAKNASSSILISSISSIVVVVVVVISTSESISRLELVTSSKEEAIGDIVGSSNKSSESFVNSLYKNSISTFLFSFDIFKS